MSRFAGNIIPCWIMLRQRANLRKFGKLGLCFFYFGISILLGACSPAAQTADIPSTSAQTGIVTPTTNVSPSERPVSDAPSASPTEIPSSTLPGATSTEIPDILLLSVTPTAIPSSAPPYDAPVITAPLDGAVLQSSMPDFRFTSPARAWSVHIVIFDDTGYRQNIIFGVGGPLGGVMNDMYMAATPVPLANGTYHWYAVGCRETAVGGCGPRSETYSFTIQS